MPEQFRFQQPLRKVPAPYLDQRLISPRTVQMDGMRHQFLPRSTLPDDGHRRLGCRHHLQALQQGPHVLMATMDAAEAESIFQHFLQLKVFPAQPDDFSDPFDDQQQLIHLKRLGDVIIGPKLDGTDRRIDRRMRRDQNDLRRRAPFLTDLEDCQPVGAGETQVRDYHIKLTRTEYRHPLSPGCRCRDLTPHPLQGIEHGQSHQRFVIDNEHPEPFHENLPMA
ncbi:hypothetical protein NSPZN2_160057 [Nitrospira defluvii]|uniref:Uncharacterized protein n=1 Tax=Nitrospira defluvii TaxID=330214 RepID=A0ABM8RC06_9BACT|nr:hypothetical protein NSPZN2_160057 [Nitrospira defluvii]